MKNNQAKFAFFYILSLVALVFTAISAGMIVFQIINKNIVDILEQYGNGYSPDALKFGLSALIIAAPIYYLATRQIQKNLFSGELDKDSGIRKWLTYLIILVASVVMLGWLVAVINSFLDGELTLKFILKTLTALIIAAGIASFYVYDLKREEVKGKKSLVIKNFFAISLVLVVAAFVGGLFFVESPLAARNRKYDQLIMERFNQIDNAIQVYYSSFDKLPERLDQAREEYKYMEADYLTAPGTDEQFEYKIISDNKYQLCAEFKTSNKNEENNYQSYYNDLWPHDAGYQCLDQKVMDENNAKGMLD